ncbi:MAG: hypothetical protein K0S30_1878 [Clostridia bacterium]|jgi:hypothetical protein|nr:hypothetical protein [Clostridia bacterium]
MIQYFKKCTLNIVLGIFIVCLLNGCNKYSFFLYNQDQKAITKENETYNDSIFEIKMLDHYNQSLPSRHIEYNGKDKYTLEISDTDMDIIGYKIMLLIDGVQYHLSENSTEIKMLLLKAEEGKATALIDFSKVSEGHHFGMFIIEKIYESPRKILTQEVDMRFTIHNSQGGKALNGQTPLLKVLDSDNTTLLPNIAQSIEFVAFPSQVQPPYEIRQNNIVSQDIQYYDLYLYNDSLFETTYWIGVISEGIIMTNALDYRNGISLKPYEETVVQVVLSDIDIVANATFYFIAIPHPQQACDFESFNLALKEGKNIYTLFSQKFISIKE